MSRSTKKGPYVDPKLLKKIGKLGPGAKEVIKTWSRDSEISPEMVGFTFGVHNGKNFIEVKVSEDMVGRAGAPGQDGDAAACPRTRRQIILNHERNRDGKT
ncbi:MAG: Ribosomal protein S19 [Candidatus Jorgensenbacteria bacterium GW2011_GWC1_48_8]|uniref:Small ribosomal subunit protein uS19 n=1 Tax=Candidatus Jorgensenbacteria bacterium GW2011_GWC1_48_8 TaxID=1618666 RepID=A0A0G1UYQ6_9BACT|nr:MAG: Ribosomal protein S19 [Candidatus Jorgensenbacteria bacterium GW2011_GWC1_48_8]